jgi:alkaline phosphatase D
LLGALLLTGCGSAVAGGPRLLAIGDVRPTTAVLWMRGDRGGAALVEYGPAGAPPTARATISLSRRHGLTGKTALSGLAPGTRYVYRLAGGGEGGEFVTAPAAATAAPVRFLWSGDLGGGNRCRRAPDGYAIFRAMAERRPDFFLFVGDTIYADHRCRVPENVPGGDFVALTLGGYRAKHAYNREDPAYRTFLAGTSVYAIWDDHEVGNDFAGPWTLLMPVGRRAFLDYWPIAPSPEDPTRLHRSFRWGALLDLFILDTRQYRSHNSEPDAPGKTMLGDAQRRWLLEGLAASTATWKVVVSSVPLSIRTGRGHRDSWSNAGPDGTPQPGTGFASERHAILEALHAGGVRNVVFVVADVHHAEIIRHEPRPGWVVHELAAGPLSATPGRVGPLDRGLNPRSLFALGGLATFGEVAVDGNSFTARLFNAAGTELFAHTMRPE